MLSLKILRRRINSVKSTQQITRAMYMVAAARLRRAQERIISFRPYADKMKEVIESVSSRVEAPYHPLLERREPKRVEILVISTERGLCGSYNQNLFRRVDRFLKENEGRWEEVSFSILGRKGIEYYRRREIPIRRDYLDRFRVLDYGAAKEIAKDLMEDFLGGEVDLVYLAYSFFRSPLVQRPTVEALLPLEPFEPEPGEHFPVEHLYEPPATEILADLLPRYVEVRVWKALLEHVAGEHGARMTAMDAATQNAQELIDKLTLMYNKARQSAITKEMIEIATGAEALKQ